MIHFDLAAVLEGVDMPEDVSAIALPSLQVQAVAYPEPPYVVLANTAAPLWNKKRWGGYPELANRLSDAGYLVVVVGTESDARFNPPEQFPDDTIFHYDLPLLKVNYLLKHAEWVIGNDCGLVHIASAMALNTIAIFGPTSTVKNAPLGSFKSHGGTVMARSLMACAPCQYSAWEQACQKVECLESVSPARVYDIVKNGGPPCDMRAGLEASGGCLYTYIVEGETEAGSRDARQNAIDTIEECITAAARIADRFIIVDNGSTDGTLEYLMHFKAQHPEMFPVFRFDDIQGIADVLPHETFSMAQTIGYDQIRDREVMDRLLKASDATWGLFLDADEIVSDQMTRSQVEWWMNSMKYNAIYFRHVHFWKDKGHYRVDQRWKPKHHRLMWRITPESTITTYEPVHPDIVRNLKGKVLKTDYCIKHYGHIDKEKNRERAEFYRSIDNPLSPKWSGRTYEHMTNEDIVQLAKWNESEPVEARDFGVPSHLLVLLHAKGDMLMATPMIAKLKKETPDLEISVLGLGKTKERDFRTREIFENNPDVHAYYDSEIDHHPTWWDEQTWKHVDLPIIHEDIRRLQQLTCFDTISIVHLQSDWDHHRIDRFANACGIPSLTDAEKRMSIYSTISERYQTSQILSTYPNFFDASGDCIKQIISVHRWCGQPLKSWAYSEYKKVCEFLKDIGHHLILWDMGDPEAKIRDENIINMSDHTDGLTAGVGAALMEMCDLHIGADSFPMHLASAVNTPMIAIFERTPPSQVAPLNENAILAGSDYAFKELCDPVFYKSVAQRVVACGLMTVEAEHLYPVLDKMGYIPDSVEFQRIPVMNV